MSQGGRDGQARRERVVSDVGEMTLTLCFVLGVGEDVGAAQLIERLHQHLGFEAALTRVSDPAVNRGGVG